MLGLTLFSRHPAAIEHTECSVMFNDPAIDRRVRVMVLLIGLDRGAMIGTLGTHIEKFRARGREPVIVADQFCFEVLREHKVVIEILPTTAMLKEPDRDRFAAYITAKLASIRETWMVTEEVCLGQPVETVLTAGMEGSDTGAVRAAGENPPL